MEIQELLLIAVIPLFLGLVWNRWAGGAAGFLLGTIYALYWAPSYHGFEGEGPILLGYIVSGMLIGYMAGALNKGSENFIRMVIVGVTSTTVGGILLFGIFHLSPVNVVSGLYGFAITVLTRILCGILIPVVAKVFMWYGISMSKRRMNIEQHN